MIKLIDGRGKDNAWISARLNRPSQLSFTTERKQVEEILSNIKGNGDQTVIEYTAEFDRVSYNCPKEMVVTQKEIEMAYDQVDRRYLKIMQRARKNIWEFHSKQLQNSWITYGEDGVIMGQNILPMERVGVYVPGGRAAYPSSVLMNIIPAKVAGVSEIIMVTPPGIDKTINPHTLVAAREAGCEKIFKVGGAQAVGALAFGTQTIPKVDKIVGPGNIYVTLAKKEVYGYVDIDMIAGPSEILVLADCSANPAFVAADLMSQAEHDPMASAILVTNSINLACEVKKEIKKQIEKLSLKETILSSFKDYGALIVVDSLDQAVDMANYIAPEHLELAVQTPFELLGAIKHAGSIFLGHHTPEPVGDYMAGPNHVLPTSGTARFFSPLSVDDFIKKSNVLFYTHKALKDIGQDIVDFANKEGLTAHANSIKVRL